MFILGGFSYSSLHARFLPSMTQDVIRSLSCGKLRLPDHIESFSFDALTRDMYRLSSVACRVWLRQIGYRYPDLVEVELREAGQLWTRFYRVYGTLEVVGGPDTSKCMCLSSVLFAWILLPVDD